MKSKSRISGLVLATVFSLGMASSGLASAQNRGGTATLPVNDENSGVSSEKNTAQEDFVTGKEVNDVPAVAEIPDAEGLGKTQEDSATNCETDSKPVFTDKLDPKNGGATIGKGTLFGSIGATAAVASAVTGGASLIVAGSRNNNDKVSGASEELEKLKDQNSSLNDEISRLREETNGKIKTLEQEIPVGGIVGFLGGLRMFVIYFSICFTAIYAIIKIAEKFRQKIFDEDSSLKRNASKQKQRINNSMNSY